MNEILSEMITYSLRKMQLKMSVKWLQFFLGLNNIAPVLISEVTL